MRIAYFDCFAGISGDMILGALLDAGLHVEQLQAELDKLAVRGLQIQREPATRHAIAATMARVLVHGQSVEPGDENHIQPPSGAEHHHVSHHHEGQHHEDHHHDSHPHDSHHHPGDIVRLIEASTLAPAVRARSVRIFERLTAAEARVHGTDPQQVQLHEVGALDAVADVVGAVAGLHLLGVEAVYSSPLRLGTGFVTCAHGRYPVPVPGVLALCDDVPCQQTDIPGELVTPTGAAIITTLARGFGCPPPFRQHKVGYGAGRRDPDTVANLLRLRIGDTSLELDHDALVLIETNIDDMNPEVFGYLTDQLMRRGARDVFITPVYMKKGRPGSLLSVLAEEADLDRMVQTVMSETTSIGVRFHRVERRKLKRESVTVQTSYGEVRIKVSSGGGTYRSSPEYEDCARLAERHGIPILTVYDAARAALSRE